MVLISNDFPYSGISAIQNSDSGLNFEWLFKIRTKNTPFKLEPTGVKNSNGPTVPYKSRHSGLNFFLCGQKNAQISSKWTNVSGF